MQVWALWSSRVDPYSQPELIALFVRQDEAEAAKSGLIGKPRYPATPTMLFWEDDEDFPDLYVRPLPLR